MTDHGKTFTVSMQGGIHGNDTQYDRTRVLDAYCVEEDVSTKADRKKLTQFLYATEQIFIAGIRYTRAFVVRDINCRVQSIGTAFTADT